MKLTDLRYGKTAKIVQISSESDSAVRLHALGMLPERTIRRRQKAPFGDPVAYEMEGQKISIRRAEAELVEIELV